MKFIHDDPEFADLIRIVAGRVRIQPGLGEKDYWVTHTLWSLQSSGLALWLKGGTSLSKGFGLLDRFSEDLDLKIEPGLVATLALVTNWKGDGTRAVRERAAFFDALAKAITVPGAKVVVDPGHADPARRSAAFRVVYPGTYLGDLGATMKPFVLLEVGSARVTPFVERDMSSFVHDELARLGQSADFADNRPRTVRCLHPLATLLEKLDALHRRVPRADIAPASFVRHYEDAARIAIAAGSLPPLAENATARHLAEQMCAERQIAQVPTITDPAFDLPPGPRRDAILRAHAEIAPMFWGKRISIDDACRTIREWVASHV